ncbi:hypothetical protein ACFW2Y_09075 [Streptomyces sp. NPDC058877]|uniref:Rv0361 family membrane protein n=1 Tax=unclassified Streptomyces TaxID=2593676 RepID=UPI0036952959
MPQHHDNAPFAQPPSGFTPPATAPAGRGRARWYVAAAVGTAVLAGSYTAYAVFTRPESEQTKIEAVVADFAAAVDQVDVPKVVGLLCAREASGITGKDDQPLSASDREMGVKPRAVVTSDIRITGEVASAVVTRPSQRPATVHLEKEGGMWKLCAPAGAAAQAP